MPSNLGMGRTGATDPLPVFRVRDISMEFIMLIAAVASPRA